MGGQKLNLLVSTQEQNLGVNGFGCQGLACNTTNFYDNREKESKLKHESVADNVTIYQHKDDNSQNIDYQFVGNIYKDSIDLTSNKSSDQSKSMVADLEFMSIEASTPPFKPNMNQLNIDGWVGLKSTRQPNATQ